jgi:hypothetical protein
VSEERIPSIVRGLIAERLDSIPELEAVLLFRENPRREWTAEEAGKRLYVSATVAEYILRRLCEQGFFVAAGDTYRYQPECDEVAAAVEQLAVAYRGHLVEVTEVVHSKPGKNIRDFANAFRLRKP